MKDEGKKANKHTLAQRRYRESKRAAGLHEVIVWVTHAQEAAIRKILKLKPTKKRDKP